METIVIEKGAQHTEALVQQGIDRGMSYADFRTLVEELASRNGTTGMDQSEALINYTLLNDRRMRRLDKTIKIDEKDVTKILGYEKKITWLVLTESWCGDAAQTLPIINGIANLNKNITLKIILRDAHLELMNRFLTQGTLSIPKLIMVDDQSGEVIGEWGSRPSTAAQMVIDFKERHGRLTPEFKQDLQVWYNKDKGQTTIKDFLQLLTLE